MHGLETIIALNEIAQKTQKRRPGAEGWEVKLDSELKPADQAKAGLIHVFNTISADHITVDASDPHNDGPLVEFHRNWKGSLSVAYRAEALASQHRRIVYRAA